jgi:hypothetical protein
MEGIKKLSLIIIVLTIFMVSFLFNCVVVKAEEVKSYEYTVTPSKLIRSDLEKAIKEGKLDPYKYLLKKPDLKNPKVMELVKANWCQFKWKFATVGTYDEELQKKRGIRYKGFCPVTGISTRINRRGERRESAMQRWSKNYHLTDTGYDFKDLTIFLSPEDLRNMAILVLDYMDLTKDQDTFLWLPSLRKVRRVAQAEKEDSFGGMDLTYFDIVLREPEDEDHKILRTEVIGDELINQLKKENSAKEIIDYFEERRGSKFFVIESTQKLDFLSWDKRVWWLDPTNFREPRSLFYDKSGRLIRIKQRSFRKTPFYEDRSNYGWSEGYWDVQTVLTEHRTQVLFPALIFDQPTPDYTFTIRYLKRMK